MTSEQFRTAVDLAWRSKPPAERVAAAAKLLRDRADAARQGNLRGKWRPLWDSCDCGDGYGCSHGPWISAVVFEQPIRDPAGDREPSPYDHQPDSEIPTAAMQWMLTLQPAAGLALADLLEQGGSSINLAFHLQIVQLADTILASPSTDTWDLPAAADVGLVPDEVLYPPHEFKLPQVPS